MMEWAHCYSLDQMLKKTLELAKSRADAPTTEPTLHFYIFNNCPGGEKGEHWISLALEA